jgi:integrase
MDQTLRKLWDHYLEGHVKPHCRTEDKMRRMWKRYFGELAERDAASIKRYELLVWHAGLGERHGKVAANHALAQICAIYNKAIEWELFTGVNPAARIAKFKIPKRTRYLTQSEVLVFLNAVEQLKNGTARDYFWILLFTGQRKTNVLDMKWTDLDLQNGLWHIPLTKNGESHTIPLIEPAVDLLRDRQLRTRSIWVFPGSIPGRRYAGTQMAWVWILRRSGLKDLRIHDIRHTLASWQAMTGAELPLIMRTLAHKDIKSTMRYLHLNSSPVRASMAKAVNAMFS